MLRFSSGYSGKVNSAGAIEEALAQADAGAAGVVLIHSTVGHNFAPMLAKAAAICPNATIVGCTGSGVIYRRGVNESMRALAVMSISGPEVAVSFRDGVTSSNGRELATQAARELQGKLGGINAILLYTPFTDSAHDEILAGIDSVFGPDMPIAGGVAGDNAKFTTSYLFHGQMVSEHGLLMIGLADPALELLSIAHHGNRPVGQPFVVTAAEGNRILELDGAPAWPRVVQRLGLPAETTPIQAIPLAIFGIEIDESARDGYDNAHVLLVPSRTDTARSAHVSAIVAAGTRLHLMQRDEDRIFAGVDWILRRLETMIDGREIVAVFHADCLARGRLTFDRVSKDEIIGKLQKPLTADRDVPWLGLYGYGEFCPLAGRNSMHTFTTALFPIVRRRAA
jgi:small ligand-binding sensory domain FIST